MAQNCRTLPMDTVRLKFRYSLPNNVYFQERILAKELDLEYAKGNRYIWTNNHWRKEQIRQGIYTPKYWIEQDFKNPNTTYFIIETSLPKLIRGENLTELANKYLENVYDALHHFFVQIKVNIFTEQIKNAIPILLSFAQNINLTPLYSCDLALKTLSPFDYKPHSDYRFVEFGDRHRGREIIFTIKKTETFKLYSKNQEILNNALTTEEKKIANLLQQGVYVMDGAPAQDILRIELTLKTKRKIQQRFKPYLEGKPATLQNIFKKEIWEDLLKKEMAKIYNHPLKEFIFLSIQSQPSLDKFLEKNYKQIRTKDTIRCIIASLQELGLANTRKKYLNPKQYKSRQTWYNYQKRLENLKEYFDYEAIQKLDNYKIHKFILQKFGIYPLFQTQFNLSMSKKIDPELRNTNERHI